MKEFRNGFKLGAHLGLHSSVFLLPYVEINSDLGEKILGSTCVCIGWFNRYVLIEFGYGDYCLGYDPETDTVEF